MLSLRAGAFPWLFTDYATTIDRGVMRDVVFVPMFTWQGCLRLGNRLDGLTDGFLIVPTGLVAVRQVIACARNSHGNAPARNDNMEIKESMITKSGFFLTISIFRLNH